MREKTSTFAIPFPPAWPGARIGVMGGSFNPPHDGHLTVAETALRRLRLDRLWWLVTPGNPLKSRDGLAPLAGRMAAIARLTRHPRMVVTSFEAELGRPYTAATLAALVARFPATRFVWVMGADNLASLHKWHDWRSIPETCPMAVVDRPGWRLAALSSPAGRRLAKFRWPEERAARIALPPPFGPSPPAWVFLSCRLSDTSSTALRAKHGERTPLG